MKAVAPLFLFSFLVYFASCIEEQILENPELSPQERSYPNVDRALWTHFAAFEDAAADRGIFVDLASSKIIGTIKEISDRNIAGQCSYGGAQRHRDVTIDKSFWQRASNTFKEYIVFHELGHCYLFRDHLEACFQNGTYASIMRSGNGNCRDNYNARTRSYYLDELLDVNTGP